MNFAEKLKIRLSQPLPGSEAQSRLAPEHRLLGIPNSSTVSAGVLILIFPNENNELSTVFMKRPKYDGPHSAQISLPGGKYESSDKNIIDTALRESFEEIGISPVDVEVLGKITPLFIPVSNFLVHPVIGISKYRPKFKIDKKEVDYLIECTLDLLLNADIKQTEFTIKGNIYKIPYYDIKNEILWGATSMIISEFTAILSDILPK
jgi:8-oxo-dGTP pyrophosphatase MutT (NUDIX family)